MERRVRTCHAHDRVNSQLAMALRREVRTGWGGVGWGGVGWGGVGVGWGGVGWGGVGWGGVGWGGGGGGGGVGWGGGGGVGLHSIQLQGSNQLESLACGGEVPTSTLAVLQCLPPVLAAPKVRCGIGRQKDKRTSQKVSLPPFWIRALNDHAPAWPIKELSL